MRDSKEFSNADLNGFQGDEKAIELKRGFYPLRARFLNWQQSNVGDYIEFQIRVTF